MNKDVKCKKCGQNKGSDEFYKGSSRICKSCRYTPKHCVNITVWIQGNSSSLDFTKVTSYTFETLFLKIEDSQDIHYIKVDSIYRIKIRKQVAGKVVSQGIKFTSEPTLM